MSTGKWWWSWKNSGDDIYIYICFVKLRLKRLRIHSSTFLNPHATFVRGLEMMDPDTIWILMAKYLLIELEAGA